MHYQDEADHMRWLGRWAEEQSEAELAPSRAAAAFKKTEPAKPESMSISWTA